MSIYYPQARVNLSVVFDGFGGPDKPLTFEDIPLRGFTVSLNSYKEADTYEVTFNSQFFPFSPETIRSLAIELYTYQAPDALSPFVYTPENLLITGLADTGSIEQAKDGGMVKFEGRDYTCLLIDRQWDPAKSGNKGRIPVGRPLAEVVQQLVDEAVDAQQIGRTLTVRFLDGDVSPTTGRISKTVTQAKDSVKVGESKGKRKKRGIFVKSDTNYWDVIYKLCLGYGFIVFVKGFDVIISKPHLLQADAQDKIVRVAYGHNLESLESERKLSRESVPQIRVTSYDEKTRKPIEGRYPERADEQEGGSGKRSKAKHGIVRTGIGTTKEEFKTMTWAGVTNEKQLKDIARTVYHTLSRGEGKVTFKTKHLKDLPDEDGVQRDFLQLRAGDAVRIDWDAFNAAEMLNSKATPSSKVAALTALGYSSAVAAVVADQFEKLAYFRQPFYVKDVRVSWDKESGMTFEVEAMNFIDPARDGVTDGA